jgi:hypothetical protein
MVGRLQSKANLCVLHICLSACAASRAHYDPWVLKAQVAFETNCDQDRVVIETARDVSEKHSEFVLNVCGQRQRWLSFGANYYPVGRGLYDP